MTDDCMGCREPGYSHAAYCPESRVEDLRKRLADSERLREDERLTWDAQHKRQASMNAHLAALVTDAQEELRKCQQDAIQLQARLAEAEAQRTLPCGHHHSLDDSYGKCALCGTMQTYTSLEDEYDVLEARLAETRAEIERLLSREQQLQRALAFWHPGVRDDVPEAATKRAADDACLLYGLEDADEQSAADLGWVAWVVPGEFARLRSRLVEAKADMARLLRDGIVNAPCPTPGQWRQLQDFAKGYLAGADSATHRESEA